MKRHPHSVARRMAGIQPFRVMALLARARELEAMGRSIIHMEVGEPDFSTPAPIVEAGIQALTKGQTHYTPAVGLASLREAISQHYLTQFQVTIDPSRVVVTPGASGALQLALACIINPGDEVLMSDPGYPCNRNFVSLFEGQPIRIPVTVETHFQPDVQSLKQYWRAATRAIMLASPSNPTGTVIPAASMEAMLAYVQSRSGYAVVDEIYQGLTYQANQYTSLSYSDEILLINSFSKYFGMTGWRIGWLIAPEYLVPEIDKLAQNIFLAASTPAQHAALAGFQRDTLEILESRRLEYQRRRDYLVSALIELGFDIPVIPEGAFYVYAGCAKFTQNSQQFCQDLLEEIGVAITPGCDFGEFQAASHVRFAYTTAMPKLAEGIDRLSKYLSRS